MVPPIRVQYLEGSGPMRVAQPGLDIILSQYFPLTGPDN